MVGADAGTFRIAGIRGQDKCKQRNTRLCLVKPTKGWWYKIAAINGLDRRAPFQRFREARERGYSVFAHPHPTLSHRERRKRWAGTARTLFQSARTASVNAIHSGLKDHTKRWGATEPNVVVDVGRVVPVPIRGAQVVVVVVPRAAPQRALASPNYKAFNQPLSNLTMSS
jgi:hypothetical protein